MGERLVGTEGLTSAAPAGRAPEPSRPARGLSRLFRRHRRLGLFSVLSPPVLWMLVIYIGSLLLLVVTAFFTLDPRSQKPTTEFTTSNLTDALSNGKAIRLFGQSVGIAMLVTVCCALVALPTAFFIAKIAPRWVRRGLMVSILLPLWAGYMVKTYAWRAMVSPAGGGFAAEGRGGGGFMESVLGWTPGYSKTAVVIALVYMWLPYMVLPIYAGLERMPVSLLDAAGDLGARPLRTFRSVIFPLLLPAIAAGSIFTFSLSLGDYILPEKLVDGNESVMFGVLINETIGAPNQPLAAAYTVWPLLTIILYLFAMKRAGAFDNL
jgi:putative spermidine/putrescine transport system permease protein